MQEDSKTKIRGDLKLHLLTNLNLIFFTSFQMWQAPLNASPFPRISKCQFVDMLQIINNPIEITAKSPLEWQFKSIRFETANTAALNQKSLHIKHAQIQSKQQPKALL